MSRNIDFSRPLSKDDAKYVADRPWLIDEAKQVGYDVRYAKGATPVKEPEPVEPEEAEEDVEESEGEQEDVDYESMTIQQLKDEIESRNEERDEDDQIVVDGTKKQDFIDALEADDEDADESEDNED